MLLKITSRIVTQFHFPTRTYSTVQSYLRPAFSACLTTKVPTSTRVFNRRNLIYNMHRTSFHTTTMPSKDESNDKQYLQARKHTGQAQSNVADQEEANGKQMAD